MIHSFLFIYYYLNEVSAYKAQLCYLQSEIK